jgi:dipeptidyl aminopeptidase/acylaminoacyl peptidase
MLLKLVLRQFVLQRIVLRNIGRIRGLRCALRAAALAACAMWFVPSAAAGIRAVEPGTAPTLDDGEALLLIGIDTDVTLGSVRVVRSGMNFDMKRIRALEKGRNAQLFVVPAGRYRWSSVSRPTMWSMASRFVFDDDDEEFMFEVRPGRINYPGDLIYRDLYGWTGRIHFSNRSLLAMDWLQANHPSALRDHAFEYTGFYPDPFPALYREAIADRAPAPDRSLPPPEAGPLPIPIADLWRPGQLEMVELSPAGDLLAEVVTYKRGDKWRWAIDLVDLVGERIVRLYDSPKPVSRLDWAGGRSLIMSIGGRHEPDALIVANIRDDAEGRRYDTVIVPRIGLLVKVLRDEPGHILFQSLSPNGLVQVHKLDIRDQAALRKFGFNNRDRLNRGVDRDLFWYADRQGRLRMAIAIGRDGERVLMHGLDGEYRQVLVLGEDNDFQPVALSADGNLIYGTAEKDRDQRELVEFDPVAGRITRTLFSKPGIDVDGPLFDEAGDLVGVAYHRDGLLVSDYFQSTDAKIAASLRAAFPEKSVSILQRDAAGKRFVLAVGGSDLPTSVYVYDRERGRAMLISETMPWLAGYRFAPSHTIRTKSPDGFEIEAYLTLPAAAGKRPLVVFPHGGPIGVRDSRYFDPEVQFLASLGYAVLQVNFRGSEGFGAAFRKAGERSYGSAIEDDIDAALTAALAQYPLDDRRMCAMGASYGGYSAMVSAIRWRGRFRCAVSISGVSDRALFFTASDTARSKEGRTLIEQRIGDPRKDMTEMQTYSPLYRYRELDLPVMLVHGGEDFRVDYEHTRRLVRMLNLVDRPPVLIELKQEGHSIEDEDNRARVWTAIAGFLRTHLGDPLAPR